MLEQKINDDLKAAMKAADKPKLIALRMLIAAFKNRKIEAGVKDLDDAACLAVIQKVAKQYKESIFQFKEGGREDLVAKESIELSALEGYLPEQMSEDEITSIVGETIIEAGADSPKDIGKVMSLLMPKLKGRADGKIVNKIVMKKLN